MKETDCRKCCVCAFKDDLCKEDFCEKYYSEGSAEDFEKLLPHWIPVMERLPENDGMYYVTIKDGAGEVDAVPCVWYDKKWAIGGAEVIAWIAIPEPYKEERKEE